MARNRQIGPKTGGSVTRPAPPSAGQVQAEYRAMLDQDFGPAVFNRIPSRDNGRPVGLIRLLLRPAGLFALALLAMCGVLGVKLWREGVFESFRLEHSAPMQVHDKSWMLGDRLPAPRPEKAVDPDRPEVRQVLPPEAADRGDATIEDAVPE